MHALCNGLFPPDTKCPLHKSYASLWHLEARASSRLLTQASACAPRELAVPLRSRHLEEIV